LKNNEKEKHASLGQFNIFIASPNDPIKRYNFIILNELQFDSNNGIIMADLK
jgi:hypothetical protein